MDCSGECCRAAYPTFRPRGALARALYHKQMADEQLACLDYSQWYTVDGSQLGPGVEGLFAAARLDRGTEQFLARSTSLSDNVLLQLFYSLVKIFLGFFMTQTSINGMLGRGSMFVFSGTQFGELSGRRVGQDGSLLDLGAGDGSVTQVMEPFFSRVDTTEVSKQMRSQLAARGFRVVEESEVVRGRYSMVSCLNVLDRCDKPLTMLSDIKAALRQDGTALLALVLPFKPYVETGFKVERWSRLPYLCEGDLSQSFYWLDDALFLLSVNHSSPS